ncbi:MAG: succinate dehydrogenase/fumarate reductase flavoprotein subunit [Dehalococcoidia bacterium]|nr:succinate dehydrogenase/fumarate reductase flavoprotein subunit [Dehalococcoidia bacterium]
MITEKKFDVVVVGAGMAGLAAAIEAAAGGVRVALLDKLAPPGGPGASVPPEGIGNETSRAGGGGLARTSLEASVEELLGRHVAKGWGRIDPTLIRVYLENLIEDSKWLRESVGLPYAGGRAKGKGAGVFFFLHGVAVQRGVEVILGAKVLRLLTDEVGRVTGVRAKAGDRVIDFKAGAVVLATGGFEGNQEMVLKYAGPVMTYGTVVTGCPTNTGDGHRMASEIGAQLINLSVCHARPTDTVSGQDPTRPMENIYPMGIFINRDCQRFVDEGTADSDTIGNAIAHQPGSESALIFDEKARAKHPEEYEKYPAREKVIHKAATIEELALKIKMSPEKLKKFIVEFNAAVKEGKALGLPLPKTEQAYRIDTAPFYAIHPLITGLDHPLGGLKINTRAQVLDRESNPIPGLYAAGSLVNWAFGRPYTVAGVTSYTGTYHAGESGGLPMALVFGRIAGRGAAQEALKARG